MKNAVEFLQEEYRSHIREKFGRELDEDDILTATYEPPEWFVRAMEKYAVMYGKHLVNLKNHGQSGTTIRQLVFNGSEINCTKKQYYSWIKDELGNLAKEFLLSDMFMSAKHAMDERQRLNEKFNFKSEED